MMRKIVYFFIFFLCLPFVQHCTVVTFHTMPSWGIPFLIMPDAKTTNDDSPPVVAVDGAGNAITAWIQLDDGYPSVWVSRHKVGEAWEATILIEKRTGEASKPQIAMDRQGNAIVVWQQANDGRTNIYTNRYNVDAGWEEMVRIDGGMMDSSSPQVTMDRLGNAMVIWRQFDSNHVYIYTNRYDIKTGWGSPTEIKMNMDFAFSPRIAMDGNGNAVAVWYQWNGTRYQIWGNRYKIGVGWDRATFIENNSGDAIDPQVAIDDPGNVLVMWRQFDTTDYRIYARHYESNEGWGTAVPIEDHSDDAIYPHLIMDGHGNGLAVWVQRNCIQRRCIYSNIWFNQYQKGAGWGRPTKLAEDSTDVQIAADGGGNAVVVWSQLEGIFQKTWRIRTNWFKAEKGFEGNTSFKMDGGNAFHPTVAINSNGDSVVVWEQLKEENRAIWANSNKINLILMFTRPAELVLILEFDITNQGGIVDQVLTSEAFYLQPGRDGDRFLNKMENPRILVEVSGTDFKDEWTNIWYKSIFHNLREKGLSRQQAKIAAQRLIEDWRKFGQLRMDRS